MGGAGTNKNDYNNTVLDSAARVAGAASPAGVVGGLRSGNQVFTEDSIDRMIERGTSARSSDAVYTPAGAEHPDHARHVEPGGRHHDHAGPEPEKGTDIMQHPSMVVRPGEKATFFSGRELIYPTEYDPPESPNSTGRDYNNDDYWGDDDDVGERIPIMPMTPRSSYGI